MTMTIIHATDTGWLPYMTPQQDMTQNVHALRQYGVRRTK